jgi:hypothetical protein
LAKDVNLPGINQLISRDVTIRQEAVNNHNLSLAKELFCFGRPMFQSVSFYNMALKETGKGLEVSFT